MRNFVYLLAALLLFTTGCGDSNDNSRNEPELLFVQNSDGAVLTDSTLILTGVSGQTSWFTDRPDREAGQIRTENFILAWGEGENSFADDPPNADFTCTVDSEVVNYVVELTSPVLDGADLTYAIQPIGDSAPYGTILCDDDASLFIDNGSSEPCYDGLEFSCFSS